MRDEELDQRLRSADRMARVTVPEEVFDHTFAAARDEAGRRRRWRTGVIAGALALGLGGGVAAAPAVADTIREWLAVAEWQPAAGGEILPDSEMVDLSAPDLPEYIASRFPDWLPIPPGTTKEQMIADVVAIWQNVPDAGFTQEVGFRYDFERLSYCGWVDAWLTSGDPLVVARATVVMRDAIDWPAFVATDGDGVVPTFLTAYALAAESADRDGVEYAAWQYGCDAWDGDPRAWWIAENEWFQQNDPRR